MSDKDNYHYFIYKGHIHKIFIKDRSEDTNEKEISIPKVKIAKKKVKWKHYKI